MAIFEYTSVNDLGRQERGTVEAPSTGDARRKLRASRVHVVNIVQRSSEDSSSRNTPWLTFRSRRIKSRELSVATRQLATLLNAGMSLVPSLSALTEQLSGQPLARIIGAVRDRVNEGATLAAALREHPEVFSELYVNMVQAGETAGALIEVLRRLADMTEKSANLTNKVKAAMAYPVMMAIMGIGVVIFLLSFVVPSITKLFLEMNRELPWLTLALIEISSFVRHYFWGVFLISITVVCAVRLYINTPDGRYAWDRLKLGLPLLGDLYLKMAISRFARTLGVLRASGVSILDALDIVKRVVGNVVIAEAIETSKEEVEGGNNIADPLRKTGVFPPIVIHMIAVGENSGNIEDGLLNIGEAYDSEVESTVAALTSLIEPLMIVVMGGIVGFIVLAILLPIFDINQAIR